MRSEGFYFNQLSLYQASRRCRTKVGSADAVNTSALAAFDWIVHAIPGATLVASLTPSLPRQQLTESRAVIFLFHRSPNQWVLQSTRGRGRERLFASCRRSDTWTCKATPTQSESRQDVSARFSEKALPPADPIEAKYPPNKYQIAGLMQMRLAMRPQGVLRRWE